ncbi:MAG: glutamate--tRNA ligase [Deltaproteobacteria bacterium]|nr:glutamate--tRNA ligase [Deltaproteobacteria bacterium]
MKEIVTRFAPSPSGYLHVGGARTALFNWLYTRHNKGKFILRIEDTDKERSTDESIDAIIEALNWLGIDYDEGPYFQSQRFSIYEEYIEKLIDSGQAYYCNCPQERLDKIRQEAMKSGSKPKYDGKCRNLGLKRGENSVVRFASPLDGVTILEDAVKKNIVFQNSELDDFIIARSDKTSTYNFVVVVDDITMGINTIIRGDDHVNNTPKQILLYNALYARLPVFAHVPMVLGKDKARLSKRHGAMSVTAYRDMGYLPDAMINYLVRLGWSYGDQEFFTKEDLIEKFTLNNIGRSAGVFDTDKLLALNADHIKGMEPKKLFFYLNPFLKNKDIEAEYNGFMEGVIKTLNKRSKTLADVAEGSEFYFAKSISFEDEKVRKLLNSDAKDIFLMVIEQFEKTDDFSEAGLEKVFVKIMKRTGLKLGKIASPVRAALTGKSISPGIFEMVEVLGKEKTIERLKAALEFIEIS